MILTGPPQGHREGRKPRASGDDPWPVMNVFSTSRVNPARAGMIPQVVVRRAAAHGKPRASGDDPPSSVTVTVGVAVNPARAGMIPSRPPSRPPRPRKPRASGDDPSAGTSPTALAW